MMSPKTSFFLYFTLGALFVSVSADPKEEIKKPDKCSGAVRITKEITPPVLMSKVKPSFPKESLHKKRPGTPIIAEAVINETGIVICAKIIRSEHADLNASVLDAISKWKYKPALKSGKPVSVNFVVTVHIDVR
jgi:protein TonB